LNVHNFEAVLALGLKPGIAILQSLYYTCCKFCAPLTSSLDVVIAHVTCSLKSAVLCLTILMQFLWSTYLVYVWGQS